MENNFFLEDTKYSNSYCDMIERTEIINDGIIYYYNKNYIIGKTIQYQMFDGIWMVFHDLTLNKPELYPMERDGLIQMNYCISGRCELHYKNNKVYYVGQGDFVIGLLKNKHYKHSFPLGHYNGVSIIATKEKLDLFLQELFHNSKIITDVLFDKLKKNREYIAMINQTEIAMIFQEMSLINHPFFKEKCKIKFAELMLLLLDNDMEYQLSGRYFDKKTVNIVKHIKNEATSNLDKHLTINHITEKYEVSERLFAECFKEIYGNTYYAYMKEFRIKKAADLLKKTDNKIADIALMVGYQNASKFSKAFADIMCMKPINYRQIHRGNALEQIEENGVED